LPKTPPSDATPPAPIVTEEAKEAAKKLWEIVKTVVTVGGRTAWLELTNPEPVLEGTLTERLKVESVTMPKESAFWLTIVAGIVLLVFALDWQMAFPIFGDCSLSGSLLAQMASPILQRTLMDELGWAFEQTSPKLELEGQDRQRVRFKSLLTAMLRAMSRKLATEFGFGEFLTTRLKQG
jgi:hypothetical protein